MAANSVVMSLLSLHAAGLRDRFGLKRLAVFGSTARGEDTEASDVDVLVEFEGPPTFDRFMDLKFELEEILGRPVDLVTAAALKPQVRATVEKESVCVGI